METTELIQKTGVDESVGEYLQRIFARQKSTSIEVTDNVSYATVGEKINVFHKALKYVESQKAIYRKPAKEALDNIDDLFNPAIDYLKWEIGIRKQALVSFQEKARQLEDAERRRLRDEQAEAERKAREKLEQKAKKAEEKGDLSRADEIRSQPVVVPQAPLVAEAPRSKGQQDKWTVIIEDVEAIIKWQADNPDEPFRPILEISPKDITRLKKQATLFMGKLEIPGIRTQAEITIRAGG